MREPEPRFGRSSVRRLPQTQQAGGVSLKKPGGGGRSVQSQQAELDPSSQNSENLGRPKHHHPVASPRRGNSAQTARKNTGARDLDLVQRYGRRTTAWLWPNVTAKNTAGTSMGLLVDATACRDITSCRPVLLPTLDHNFVSYTTASGGLKKNAPSLPPPLRGGFLLSPHFQGVRLAHPHQQCNPTPVYSERGPIALNGNSSQESGV